MIIEGLIIEGQGADLRIGTEVRRYRGIVGWVELRLVRVHKGHWWTHVAPWDVVGERVRRMDSDRGIVFGLLTLRLIRVLCAK